MLRDPLSAPDTPPIPAFELILRFPSGELAVRATPEGDLVTSLQANFAGLIAEEGRIVRNMLDQAAKTAGGVLGVPNTALAKSFDQWFEERIVVDAKCMTPSIDFYRDYVAWTAARSMSPIALRTFGLAMQDRGVLTAGKDRYGCFRRKGGRLAGAQDVGGAGVVHVLDRNATVRA